MRSEVRMRCGGRGMYWRGLLWIAFMCSLVLHHMYMFSEYKFNSLEEPESDVAIRKRDVLVGWLKDPYAAKCTDDVKKVTDRAVPPKLPGQNIKRIMWFDHEHNHHGLRNRGKQIDFKQCPKYKNCKLSNLIIPERDKANTCVFGPFNVDAIVFQGVHLTKLTPPKRLSSSQVWVLAERETWWYSEMGIRVAVPDVPKEFYTALFDSSFNWTMTFRRDSDIPMLYGRISPLPTTRTREFVKEYGEKPFVRRDRDKATYAQIFNRKDKTALWLVSDCSTKGKRELYVKELSKYMDVDIVGKCGNDICPKDAYSKLEADNNCLNKMIRQYRFILSFENTFYKDYITEKMFDWFGQDIVQVVYGITNYSEITPPNSIVNAADFSSPAELAKYLNILGADRERYISMLKVKSQYFALNHPQMQQDAYCQLCDKLNNIDDNRRTYPSLARWWQLNESVMSVPLYRQAMRDVLQETVATAYVTQLKIAVPLCIFTLLCWNMILQWLLAVVRSQSY